MTIHESHLTQDAVAALVDGELSSGAATRAAGHLSGCLQCRMGVQAQREAKEALHRCADVAMPGDLISRLQGIPFTTEVSPPDGGSGTLSAVGNELTLTGPGGGWFLPLASPTTDAGRGDQAPSRGGHGRWLRRGTGTVAALALGTLALAAALPAGDAPAPGTGGPVATVQDPAQRPGTGPAELRTVTVGDTGLLPPRGAAGTP